MSSGSRSLIAILFVGIALFISFFGVRSVQAQDGDCGPVLNALASGIQPETCEVVAEGSACYASDDLIAILRQKGQQFSAPNDRVDIANLRRLDTQAPYGAAVMYVDTPEDPVKIIVFGDASVDAKGGNVFTMYEQGGQPICEKTPSGMLVQTPEGNMGQVVVNGVTIRLASTAFIAMDGVLLFDQDPRSGRRYGERNPDAPLCSGFDSECDFENCPVGYRLVWGPFCREDWYDYIEPGLYRVTLHGSGQVQAGATDYNATQEDFSYGVQNLTLPNSYTFCYPDIAPGGTGFETLVKSRTPNARVDRLTLEFLGADCTRNKAAAKLSASDRTAIERLMEEYDVVRNEALNSLDASKLPNVLTGGALDEQRSALDQLRKNGCYWEIDELEPPTIIAQEEVGRSQARVYMLKNWDMDLVCKGKRSEMPENDGNFVAVYVAQPVDDEWRILQKRVYGVDLKELPSTASSQDLSLMTVTNIEGKVEVAALGVTRFLQPGEQVRIALSDYRPIDIGEPLPAMIVPESPVIDWMANDDEGLPLVNQIGTSGRLTSSPSNSSEAASPSILSGRIVFSSNRVDEGSALFVMDEDGANQQMLPPSLQPKRFGSGFVVSPDGRSIALASDGALFIYNVDSQEPEIRTLDRPIVGVEDWSPTGQNLLLIVGDTADDYMGKLAIYDLTDNSLEVLLPDDVDRANWSPDGSRIVYKLSFSDIMIIDSQGKDIRRLGAPGENAGLDWSPDGQFVAASMGDSGYGIYILSTQGEADTEMTEITEYTSDDISDTDPSWSPDGSRIAFSRENLLEEEEQIFVVDTRTGEERQLTFQGNSSRPQWVPAAKVVSRSSDNEGPEISEILGFHAVFVPGLAGPTEICVGEVFKFALSITDSSGIDEVVLHSKTDSTSGVQGPWSDWTSDVQSFSTIDILNHTGITQFGTSAYTAEPGVHYLYISATDRLGNISKSPMYEFPIVECP